MIRKVKLPSQPGLPFRSGASVGVIAKGSVSQDIIRRILLSIQQKKKKPTKIKCESRLNQSFTLTVYLSANN